MQDNNLSMISREMAKVSREQAATTHSIDRLSLILIDRFDTILGINKSDRRYNRERDKDYQQMMKNYYKNEGGSSGSSGYRGGPGFLPGVGIGGLFGLGGGAAVAGVRGLAGLATSRIGLTAMGLGVMAAILSENSEEYNKFSKDLEGLEKKYSFNIEDIGVKIIAFEKFMPVMSGIGNFFERLSITTRSKAFNYLMSPVGWTLNSLGGMTSLGINRLSAFLQEFRPLARAFGGFFAAKAAVEEFKKKTTVGPDGKGVAFDEAGVAAFGVFIGEYIDYIFFEPLKFLTSVNAKFTESFGATGTAKLSTDLGTIFTTLANQFKEFVPDFLGASYTLIKGVFAGPEFKESPQYKESQQKVISGIGTIFNAVWDNTIGIITGFIKGFLGEFFGKDDPTKDGTGAGNRFVQNIGGALERVGIVADNMANTLSESIEADKVTSFKDVGRMLGENFAKFIKGIVNDPQQRAEFFIAVSKGIQDMAFLVLDVFKAIANFAIEELTGIENALGLTESEKLERINKMYPSVLQGMTREEQYAFLNTPAGKRYEFFSNEKILDSVANSVAKLVDREAYQALIDENTKTIKEIRDSVSDINWKSMWWYLSKEESEKLTEARRVIGELTRQNIGLQYSDLAIDTSARRALRNRLDSSGLTNMSIEDVLIMLDRTVSPAPAPAANSPININKGAQRSPELSILNPMSQGGQTDNVLIGPSGYRTFGF